MDCLLCDLAGCEARSANHIMGWQLLSNRSAWLHSNCTGCESIALGANQGGGVPSVAEAVASLTLRLFAGRHPLRRCVREDSEER